MRTSVGTGIPGRCGRYVRTAVLIVYFFNKLTYISVTVGTCSTYISRCSKCVRNVGEVGVYLLGSSTFFTIHVHTNISYEVGTYVPQYLERAPQ